MRILFIQNFYNDSLNAVQDSLFAAMDMNPLFEPEPVKFSFQTPGWYFLAGIVLVFGFILFFKGIVKYRRNAYRREALKNLSEIEKNFNLKNDNAFFNEVLVLLKVVAIRAFGRQKVAPLYGDEWLLFLEEKGKNTPFRKYASTIQLLAYHQKNVDDEEFKSIVSLTKKWIKSHA